MAARLKIFMAVVITLMAVIAVRLMYLQLVRTEVYTARSEQNFTQQERIPPLRGRIFARDGTVLADNRVAYDLMYRGGPAPEWPDLQALLNATNELREPDRTRLEEARNGVVAVWNIAEYFIPAVEERIAGSTAFELRERLERTYPTSLAAHAIGYTGQADAVRNPGYDSWDLVGLTGLEAAFEEQLFGERGRRLFEVDNLGFRVGEHILSHATPGSDIVTTIDVGLQRLAEDVLLGALTYVNEDRKQTGNPPEEVLHGAFIAIDPKTGDLLAFASSPTFDQNVFTHRPSDPERVAEIVLDNEHKPLQNRAVEPYPPASLFKVVTGWTLLEHNYAAPSTRFACTATFSFGGVTWRNWATFNKGNYTIKEALGDSCNTYFWNAIATTPSFSVGWAPFIQNLVHEAEQFGFGRTSLTELPEEKRGRIPTDEWVREQVQYQHGWLPGFTLNVAIGQGDLLATPLQVARFVTALANRGTMMEPRLVKSVGDIENPVQSVAVPGTSYDALISGMRSMFVDYPSRSVLGDSVFPYPVAGKTGTAENPRGEAYTHAWFMGFTPMDDPEIAIALFIEHGGSSSRVAVPVARDFLVGWLELKKGIEVDTP